MVAKKDEVSAEGTDVASEAEVAVEATTEAPKPTIDLNAPVQVVGAIKPGDLVDAEEANICLECPSVWPLDKGVASCPACGGKTKRGLKMRAATVKAEDSARFTGDTAKAASNPKTVDDE